MSKKIINQSFNDALNQERQKTKALAATTQLNQEVSHPDTWVGCNASKTTQRPVPKMMELAAKPINAYTITTPANVETCFSSSSASEGMGRRELIDGGGRKSSDLRILSSLRIYDSHNLMNTLTAQIKLIRNLAERFSGRTHFKNSVISINVSGRPWTKRSPNPAWNICQLDNTFLRKLIFAISLSGVTGPSSQINFVFFDFFNVRGRHVSMSFSFGKLPKSFDVSVEACGVVHG